jgi:hypothetical protein
MSACKSTIDANAAIPGAMAIAEQTVSSACKSKRDAIMFPSFPHHIRLAAPLAAAAIAVAGLCYPLVSRAQDAGYRLVDKQHLDGAVKWDYLAIDSKRRHLFITRGDQVDIFDIDKKQVVGTIANTHGVHGVALAADLDRGYTSNGNDNSVTIFML